MGEIYVREDDGHGYGMRFSLVDLCCAAVETSVIIKLWRRCNGDEWVR